MATQTFGPVGLLYRGAVRRAALRHGVRLTEERSLVDSMFLATGTSTALAGFSRYLGNLVRNLEAEDHREYVAAMERAEKRRAWWGRIIGRSVRHEPLTRDEAGTVLDLLREAARQVGGSDEGRSRLRGSIDAMPAALVAELSPETLSVMASVRMRYLQHDIRTGDIRVPRELRDRILGMRMPMDTWED